MAAKEPSKKKLKVGLAVGQEPEIKQPEMAGQVPKVPFRLILSGASGSGKTNLALWLLKNAYSKGNKSFFDEVYLFSPTAKIDFNWAKVPGLKEKNRITDPSPEKVDSILQKQKKKLQGGSGGKVNPKQLAKNRTRVGQVLMIFDDIISESIVNTKTFLRTFIQGRHYNVSSMIMTQSYMKVPRSVRLQATQVCIFPSKVTELERLYTEHAPHTLNKRDFLELAQMATDPQPGDEYPFLYVDVSAPVADRFRRNFDMQISW
jgi:hypothetical protein